MEGNPLNLAPSGTASNSETADPEQVQTHVIDRLADWSAILGGLAVVVLLWTGWGFFADAATVGALGWLLALLLAPVLVWATLRVARQRQRRLFYVYLFYICCGLTMPAKD